MSSLTGKQSKPSKSCLISVSEEGISGCFHLFPRQGASSGHLFQLVINSQKETMKCWTKELGRIVSENLSCSRGFSTSDSENYKIILLLLKCFYLLSDRDEMHLRVHFWLWLTHTRHSCHYLYRTDIAYLLG